MKYTVQTNGLYQAARIKSGGAVIADVYTDMEAGDQWKTAALFAAAPELLDALRRLTNPAASAEDLDFALGVLGQFKT